MPGPPEPTTKGAVVQTDLTNCDITCLETCNARVVEKLLLTDDTVKFYTDLPCYSRLKAVLTWFLVA